MQQVSALSREKRVCRHITLQQMGRKIIIPKVPTRFVHDAGCIYYMLQVRASERGCVFIVCLSFLFLMHIVLISGKNSSSLVINIECLDAGIQKLRVTSSTDTISDGVPAEGQWGDQLSSISEESRFVTPSFSPNGGFGFKVQQLHERSGGESESGPFSGGKSFPVALTIPVTPTTVGSITASDSVASSLRLGTIGQDSFAGSIASLTASSSVPGISVASTTSESQQGSFTAPQLRDQMNTYLKKHLSSSLSTAGEEERKTRL
jgi:hypothetical protein